MLSKSNLQFIGNFATNSLSFFNSHSAQLTIKIFYLFVLYFAFHMLTYLMTKPIQQTFLPLWPVYWMSAFPLEIGVKIITLFLLFSAFLTVIKFDFFIFRLMTFIGLLMVGAYTNSFGKINHAEHLFVLISFVLIFLPSQIAGNESKTKKQLSIVLFSCQLIIMLTYTLSGIWKVETGMVQFFAGEIGSFHPYAMAYQIASRLSETNIKSLLADFFIQNIWLSWPLYLGSIYLEVFSVYIVFKPALHKLWGVFLILFHIFVYLSMAIPFSYNIFLVGLFFVYSPFSPKDNSIVSGLKQLPLFGVLLAKVFNNQLNKLLHEALRQNKFFN